jgi:hypothetical protein
LLVVLLLMCCCCCCCCGRFQAEHQGVLVRRVEPTAPEGAALKQWDILMAFDGKGTVK